MVKRKRGEYSEYYTGAILWNTAVMGLLALGLCSLLLISVGAMWQWVVEGQRHVPSTYNYYNGYTRPTNPPQQIGMIQNNTQPNTNLATILPEGTKLMLATTSGDLFGNEANGAQFSKTALHCEDVTVAPDGKTLAYIRSNRLYINVNGLEKSVSEVGDLRMPAWDVLGKRLTFVSREAVGDTVYRVAVNMNSLQPEKLLTVPEIVAPPLTNPATGRLLIVEKLGAKNTAFYTIDANCATQASCEESRRDIATIKYSVNWADYHPNAASIVFSDMDDGNLYLLATGSGEVKPLVTHQGYKRRPAFNNDGTWLAYTNVTDGNKLYLFHLTDNTMRIVPFSNVASVDWAN